ncbi:MAG: oligosaccharide flippase family protein, partial [Verrucomicrobiales bacterium]
TGASDSNASKNVMYLVFFLGCGVAAQMAGSVYSGILTGFHRWDLHNSVYAVTNIILFLSMVAALKLGHGLIGLAIVHLGCELGGRLARIIIARRVFPALSISWGNFRKQTALNMLCFGGKNFTSYISQLLLNQTINILIATHFGALALAVYARPMSLIRNLTGLVQKFAMVLTPTVSSLHAAGKGEELRDLFVQTLKFNLWYTVPILTIGFAFSKEIMIAWMGPKFGDGTLLRIIIIGFGGTIIHLPILQILSGMDKHGKLAVANLLTAIFASIAAFAWVGFNKTAGLNGLAICVAIPVFITNMFRIPLLACREIGIEYSEFLKRVYAPIFLSSLPIIFMVMAISYYKFPLNSGGGTFIIISSAICFFVASWMAVAPASIKNRFGKAANQRWKWFCRIGKVF